MNVVVNLLVLGKHCTQEQHGQTGQEEFSHFLSDFKQAAKVHFLFICLLIYVPNPLLLLFSIHNSSLKSVSLQSHLKSYRYEKVAPLSHLCFVGFRAGRGGAEHVQELSVYQCSGGEKIIKSGK